MNSSVINYRTLQNKNNTFFTNMWITFLKITHVTCNRFAKTNEYISENNKLLTRGSFL